MQDLHEGFSKNGLLVAHVVPFNDNDWDLPAFAKFSDQLILMAHDENDSNSKNGPIASQAWFEKTLAGQMKKLDPAHTIVSLGNYGYDWAVDSGGGTTGEGVTFQEAMLSAKDSEADIVYGSSLNPYFSYEEDGKVHHVWFLDASTLYNQMLAASRYRLAGYALWRLGSEDPSLWQIFNRDRIDKPMDAALIGKIEDIHFDYDVEFEGVGEILQVVNGPTHGKRKFEVASNGLISGQQYLKFPSAYVIQRTGGQVPQNIALTFDDGPDPKWTIPILDVLKAKGVPATFFILGQNANRNTDIIRRIVQEGHELGNHTYTHPNLSGASPQEVDLELSSTERLIESITGRQMRLWRAPYAGDAEPKTPEQIAPILTAQNRFGSLAVGLKADPLDWDTDNPDNTQRATTERIVERTISSISNPNPQERGQIVLLHDAGGDRSATVAALPLIIDRLQAQGYHFVTAGAMAGLSVEQSMPPVPKSTGSWQRQFNTAVFSIAFWFESGIFWIFIVGAFLGIGRIAIVITLALIQRYWWRDRQEKKRPFSADYQPFVSVVVPAFNEEAVIGRTISTLLQSDYPGRLEIIVVDDGSTDHTFGLATDLFCSYSNVQVFRKPNAGKAAALNFGIQKAQGEIIVALDADTLFAADSIRLMVRHFIDERVGAVAGNAKVGNRINLVTRWQALEYIISQNLDRRVFSMFNCITVVPGAIGAWRKSSIVNAGGFSHDTLAEDQDLTIALRQTGQIIAYEEQAMCYTEAPDTLKALAKQRYRWGFGTLQCAWKYRKSLFSARQGTLGWIGLPNTWLFQIIFSLISPIADLMLLYSIFFIYRNKIQHPVEYSVISGAAELLTYFAVFFLVDLFASWIAFKMEKEDKSLLLWLVLQRFVYRQVVYYVMLKSFLTAFKGLAPGWGKLERKSTVRA